MIKAKKILAAAVAAVVAACASGSCVEVAAAAHGTECPGVAPHCHLRLAPVCLCAGVSRTTCQWECVAAVGSPCRH